VTAQPRCSDVDLLGYGERIIDLDAKVPDPALSLNDPSQSFEAEG
jgi:hypothetical protein